MALGSSAPAILWEEKDCLVGEGERAGRQGSEDIAVWRAGLYLDAAGARQALIAFVGRTHEELASNPGFFAALAEGRFRKTLRLSFSRHTPEAKLQAAFRGALTLRAGLSCAKEIALLTSCLSDAYAEDVLTLRFDADGERVELDATWREPPCLAISSRAFWLALQQVFFDAETDMPQARAAMVQRLPELALAAPQPSETESVCSTTASLASAEAPSRRGLFGRSNQGRRSKAGEFWARLQGRATNEQADTAAREAAARRGHEQVYLQEIAQLRCKLQEARSAAEASRQQALRFGALLGAALALFVALLLGSVLSPELQRPALFALCLVLATGATLCREGAPGGAKAAAAPAK